MSWEPIEVAEEPEPMPKCPIGVYGHTWLFSIEEGQITLLPKEPCPEWHGLSVCHEDAMSAGVEVFESSQIEVHLRHATDCPGRGWNASGSHPSRCDCNHWFEIVWPGEDGAA